MNNLTTRKIVLGLLMTLVLAFSVQGIADAIDSKKLQYVLKPIPCGDKIEQTFGNNFTLRLTVLDVWYIVDVDDDDTRHYDQEV